MDEDFDAGFRSSDDEPTFRGMNQIVVCRYYYLSWEKGVSPGGFGKCKVVRWEDVVWC